MIEKFINPCIKCQHVSIIIDAGIYYVTCNCFRYTANKYYLGVNTKYPLHAQYILSNLFLWNKYDWYDER